MESPVRLAIIGAGRMGAFHARALSSVEELDVVALVDPSPGALELAEEVGVRTVRPRVGDLDRLDTIDAWLVAAPTHLHPEMVSAALERGIPVLCEKPLSLDLAVGLELERSVGTGLVQVGFWRRFSPPWSRAKAAIADGVIGRPLMLRLSQWDANPPPASFCDPAVSGGLAIDCGIHEFDLIEWLTGRTVTRVLSRSLPIVDASLATVGDVDNLVVLAELDDGAVATVDLSRNARYADDVRTEVLGSDGALFVEMLPTGRLVLGRSGGLTTVPEATAADPMEAGVIAQALAFAACVRGDDIDIPGAGEANRALAIGLAAQLSAKRDRWVDVDEVVSRRRL